MSEPFVLQREAAAEPFVASVGEHTLTMKHIVDVDQFSLAELFANSKPLSDLEFLTSLFRLTMDEDEFTRLRGLNLSRNDLNALFDAYKKHCGTDEGESPASSA